MGETLLVSLKEGTKRIAMAEKTARNWLTAGKFPIPTHLIGSRRMIRVSDLEAFVAGLGSNNHLQPVAETTASNVAIQKRPRGRPRKWYGATTQTTESWTKSPLTADAGPRTALLTHKDDRFNGGKGVQ